jgi:hypothetical protein
MWTLISSTAESSALMHAFGGFHDSCVRDMQIWGGYFVSDAGNMGCPPTPDLNCRVVIQRQFEELPAIELLFRGVSHISLAAPAGFDRIISRATLHVQPGRIIWSPDQDFDPSQFRFEWSSAIVATHAWWRPLGGGLGRAGVPTELGDLPSDFAL